MTLLDVSLEDSYIHVVRSLKIMISRAMNIWCFFSWGLKEIIMYYVEMESFTSVVWFKSCHNLLLLFSFCLGW